MPPRFRRLSPIALLATLALTHPAHAGPLDDELQDLMRHTNLAGATVSVLVIDPDSDRVLASHNPDTPLIPASNQKLLTSGAALITLGDSFAFRTEFLLDDTNLIIRGSGDPGLGDPVLLERSKPPMTVEDLLERLATTVAQRADGPIDQIIADDRVFDREFAHPSWPEKDLNRWYCAEVAGLGFHTNVVSLFLSPAPEGPGAAPRLSVQPDAPVVNIRNRARTVNTGSNTAWAARPTPGNDFTLYGNIRHPAQAPIRAAIHEPPTFAGRLLWHALRQTGIDIDPEPNVRLATHEDRFADAQLLAVVSTPLAEALRRCNTDSHNLYAESMIKRLGSEVTSNAGSWANGAAVVRMLISERLGAEHASTVHIADGSGMSRDNRVTVSTLAAWLEHIADDPALFQPFVASLATPGEGTLTSRFRNAELENSIHAKSGYLTGVYALSGYAIDPVTSKRLVFAMIVNEGARSSGNARNFLDEFVEDIDDYLTTLRPARANAQGG